MSNLTKLEGEVNQSITQLIDILREKFAMTGEKLNFANWAGYVFFTVQAQRLWARLKRPMADGLYMMEFPTSLSGNQSALFEKAKI